MKKALLILSLALFCLDAQAQTGAFARMGFGARGVALGNALVADDFTDTSPYYNPAHAFSIERQNLEGGVVVLPLDRELQFLQLAAPLRPRAGIAAGLIHAGVSGIDGRDRSGYHTQDYRTDEFAGFLAFGTRLTTKASVGVAMQFFRAQYTEDMSPETSLGIDLGLRYRLLKNLSLGFVVEDLLARYEWDSSEIYGSAGRLSSDRFPVRLRAGLAFQGLRDRARIYGEVQSMQHPGGDLRVRTGVEYLPISILSVRAGVDGAGRSDQHFSAGFAVQQPLGNLLGRAEYAFVPEPFDGGRRHYLSVKIYL